MKKKTTKQKTKKKPGMVEVLRALAEESLDEHFNDRVYDIQTDKPVHLWIAKLCLEIADLWQKTGK